MERACEAQPPPCAVRECTGPGSEFRPARALADHLFQYVKEPVHLGFRPDTDTK